LIRSTALLAAVAASAAMTSGCAVNREIATVDPSADLGGLRTIHVVKAYTVDRGVDALIADKLRSRGYKVTSGADKPPGVDAVVTYVDRWAWDITMYLVELTITIRDPGNDYPLANGRSYHTSVTRKSPPEMVDEVLNNIFNKAKY
jgi:hypothetical protein